MASNWSGLVVLSAAGLVLFGSASHVAAQQIGGEQSISNLSVKKVHTKTVSLGISVWPTAAPIFSPTTITCPSPGPCAVHVQVTLGIIELQAGDYFFLGVHLDGHNMPPNLYTSDQTPIATGGSLIEPAVVTLVGEVQAGTHVVEVDARTNTNYANAGARTLTVSVMK